jgi:hypothetical protein
VTGLHLAAAAAESGDSKTALWALVGTVLVALLSFIGVLVSSARTAKTEAAKQRQEAGAEAERQRSAAASVAEEARTAVATAAEDARKAIAVVEQARVVEQKRHEEALARAAIDLEQANLAEFQAKNDAFMELEAYKSKQQELLLGEYRALLATKDEQQAIADRQAEAMRTRTTNLEARLERLEDKNAESQELAMKLAVRLSEADAKVAALETEVVELQGVVEKLQEQARTAGLEELPVRKAGGRRVADIKPKPAAE